ncbi:MAG: COX15/CtaA family protein [Candidatus Methylomirabilales bacterium]
MAQSLRPLHIGWRKGNVGLHRCALLTAGATFLLIFVGGIVTSMGAGLAVPDWPTTFGHNMFLYPWSKMVGGILYEHSHRLIGAGVGLLTLALALWLWITEPRGWLRWLGVVALVAVVVQGVLGGLRVVFLERTLAIIHAAVAQAFFALTVGVAFFTSAEGREELQKTLATDASRLRRLALLTMGLIYVQLVFGAMVRHMGAGLGAHLFFAAVVTILIFCLAGYILRNHAEQPKLVRPVTVLSGLLILQLVLGLGSYLGKFTTLAVTLPPLSLVTLTTGHVATGALMLATCLVLTLRLYRLLPPRVPAVAREFVPTHPAGRAEQVPARGRG